MKELVAILIVWQATPLDQLYEPEPDFNDKNSP
ncbi:MAG: hypothetical protein QG662_1560 [Pseudomonadota bacterium]|nr:hypothetical protein [Pseudomonadota bacterium]